MKYLCIVEIIVFSFLFVSCDFFFNESKENEHSFDTRKANAEIVTTIPLDRGSYIFSVNGSFCFDSTQYLDYHASVYWYFEDIINNEIVDIKSFHYDIDALFPQTDELRHFRGMCCGIIDTGEKYIFLREIRKQVLRPRLDSFYWDQTIFYSFFEINYDGSNLCLSDITNDLPNADSITSIYYDNIERKLYTVHSDDTLNSDDKQVLSIYNYDWGTHHYSLIRTAAVKNGYNVTKGGGYIYVNEYKKTNYYFRIYWYNDFSAKNPIIITFNYLDLS